MKTPIALLLLATLVHAETPALKVHEWGTFTVLQGSNGIVIPWYQPENALAELPPFVHGSMLFAGKSTMNLPEIARMETPVLYFYPAKAMDVSVKASYPNGRITEIFPPASSISGRETVWNGRLHAPKSALLGKVPEAPGQTGRHYAAARAVPDAWLFQSTSQTPLKAGEPIKETAAEADGGGIDGLIYLKPKEHYEPVDHFIFYRGAGKVDPCNIRAEQGENPATYTLSNYGGQTIPRLFALRVDRDRTSWIALDPLDQIKYEERKILNQVTFTFAPATATAKEAADSLRNAMKEALSTEGLTRAEAAAMVATWDDLWFTEPGTRILAILPQEIPDAMVPLEISPRPSEIKRVFVARIELLTRQQETSLTSLLTAPPTPEVRQQFQELKLGRFASGALERATALVNQSMRANYASLGRPE